MKVLALASAVRPSDVNGHRPAKVSIGSAPEWAERVDSVVSSTQRNGDENRVAARRCGASEVSEQCGTSSDRTTRGQRSFEKPSTLHQ
jgi:hypothetical protein